jgi:hypothetical protein
MDAVLVTGNEGSEEPGELKTSFLHSLYTT